MADHRATWVRLRELVRQRFPNDDLAAEIAARELFDAEETAAYTADMDAQVEAQGILSTARAAKHLRDELRDELRVEGSGAGGNRNDNDDEYVHLVDDLDAHDLAYLELPTDEEASEAAAEQRALIASFEMQRYTSLPNVS
jgi:hypothetical protein